MVRSSPQVKTCSIRVSGTGRPWGTRPEIGAIASNSLGFAAAAQ